MTLVHKCTSGNIPDHLKSFIAEYKPGISGLRSQNKVCNLVIPFTKCKTFADRAFSVVRPKLWNRLPNYIKQIDKTDWGLQMSIEDVFIWETSLILSIILLTIGIIISNF